MATNKRLIKSNDEGGPTGPASFNTFTYTADGAVTPITGVGFQPDFVWIKGRTLGSNHQLTDVVRTAPNCLGTNGTGTETTRGVQSFDSDGFTLQVFPNENGDSNTSGEDYVAWCWKAAGYANTFNVLENGTTTTGSTAASVGISTTGSNSTIVGASINKDTGFSITTHSIGGSYPEWISHGLGVIPDLVITKPRSTNEGWLVNIGPGVIDSNNWTLTLNNSNAASVNSRQMTSTVVPLTYTPQTQSFVSYAFKSVPGFSKFGSYTGNSGTQSINVGFEPAFVLIKASSIAYNWYIFDNKRGAGYRLFPDLSNAEDFSGNQLTSFDSDGFTLGNSLNTNNSGQTFIYMAFANQF